jgi:hypothetical protein
MIIVRATNVIEYEILLIRIIDLVYLCSYIMIHSTHQIYGSCSTTGGPSKREKQSVSAIFQQANIFKAKEN